VELGDALIGAARDGLYRSTDAGETWRRVAPGVWQGRDPKIAASPTRLVSTNPDGITFESETLFKWSDDGLTWHDATVKLP
jgi:hypothetical protein